MSNNFKRIEANETTTPPPPPLSQPQQQDTMSDSIVRRAFHSLFRGFKPASATATTTNATAAVASTSSNGNSSRSSTETTLIAASSNISSNLQSSSSSSPRFCSTLSSSSSSLTSGDNNNIVRQADESVASISNQASSTTSPNLPRENSLFASQPNNPIIVSEESADAHAKSTITEKSFSSLSPSCANYVADHRMSSSFPSIDEEKNYENHNQNENTQRTLDQPKCDANFAPSGSISLGTEENVSHQQQQHSQSSIDSNSAITESGDDIARTLSTPNIADTASVTESSDPSVRDTTTRQQQQEDPPQTPAQQQQQQRVTTAPYQVTMRFTFNVPPPPIRGATRNRPGISIRHIFPFPAAPEATAANTNNSITTTTTATTAATAAAAAAAAATATAAALRMEQIGATDGIGAGARPGLQVNVHHMTGAGPRGGGGAGHGPTALFLEPDPLLARARHRLYSLLLFRAAMTYFLAVPRFVQRTFEISILFAAIVTFALLIHLHVSFIRSPLTCLDGVKANWPRDGILRVQISTPAAAAAAESSHHVGEHDIFLPMTPLMNEKFGQNLTQHIFASNKSKKQNFFAYELPMKPLTLQQYRAELSLERAGLHRATSTPKSSLTKSSSVAAADVYLSQLLKSINESSHEIGELRTIDEYARMSYVAATSASHLSNKKDWPYMVEYSLEYGLLRLSEDMRRHYSVPVRTVILSPERDACFGDPLARFMLRNFLGYDDVLIGSIKRLAENENNRGYVRNVATGEHFRFVNVWMTRASYISAAFIMIVFTLFVSMLIRYSHQQVFVFVSEFLRTVELQQPFSRITLLIASLITVILALIGMEAIMFEFFSDSSIAFHVILMVWASDQFYSMAIRSPISRRHFLRFFYLYQFAFYAYHYRFNGQYSGLALLVTMLFTYHSMIFFFHHYELPLLQAMGTAIQTGAVAAAAAATANNPTAAATRTAAADTATADHQNNNNNNNNQDDGEDNFDYVDFEDDDDDDDDDADEDSSSQTSQISPQSQAQVPASPPDAFQTCDQTSQTGNLPEYSSATTNTTTATGIVEKNEEVRQESQ